MSIGYAQLGTGATVGLAIGFVVMGSLSVLIPIVAHFVAPSATASALVSTRTWLSANSDAIVIVVLLVLGVHVVGNGIASF